MAIVGLCASSFWGHAEFTHSLKPVVDQGWIYRDFGRRELNGFESMGARARLLA